MAKQGPKLTTGDFATIASGIAGLGIWWFLSNTPSHAALTVAGISLAYLCVMFCLLTFFFSRASDPKEESAKPEDKQPPASSR